MPFQSIQFEASGAIAVITVNRPEKRNALTVEMLGELGRAFEEVRVSTTLKGLILTGAGDQAFAAGADIKELAKTMPIGAEELSQFGQKQLRLLETMRKPSVAAINAHAFGGGLELALCCTVRFAAPEALLGQPEVKLGTIPGYGATQRLPRLIGRSRALDMLLTAQPVTAEEAFRIGLVNRVVPRENLLAFSHQWLHQCLLNAPYAIGLTMDAVDIGLTAGADAGFRFESAAFGLIASTEDRREGFDAFAGKRTPKFTGL